MTDTEWTLTKANFNEIDDQIDRDRVFAKGYWENVDGKLTVTGLRIGSGPDRIIAKYGDTVIRHAKGKYTVRRAPTPGQLAEQLHQLRDLDPDSICRDLPAWCREEAA